MRREPCVKLCPGQRAGQARSCVALTGTYRKGGAASGATCRSFQAPTAHPTFRDHPSQQPPRESTYLAQTWLLFELLIKAVATSWLLLSGAPALKALSPPTFTHRCSLTKAEKLRTTCFPPPPKLPLHPPQPASLGAGFQLKASSGSGVLFIHPMETTLHRRCCSKSAVLSKASL